MILGLGTDLLYKERIENIYNKFSYKFITKILSNEEIKILDNILEQNKKISFIAKRFSAKESFLKAIGIGMGRGILLTDITIENDKLGKPFFNFEKKVIDFLKNYYNKYSIEKINFILSITDERNIVNTITIIDYDK